MCELLFFFFFCSSDQKQDLLDVGIFAVLVSILNGLILSANVIAEVFCVIACLSDICKCGVMKLLINQWTDIADMVLTALCIISKLLLSLAVQCSEEYQSDHGLGLSRFC